MCASVSVERTRVRGAERCSEPSKTTSAGKQARYQHRRRAREGEEQQSVHDDDDLVTENLMGGYDGDGEGRHRHGWRGPQHTMEVEMRATREWDDAATKVH